MPLSKWFHAVALWIERGEDLKSTEIERELGVSYRTAWALRHKLKSVLKITGK